MREIVYVTIVGSTGAGAESAVLFVLDQRK